MRKDGLLRGGYLGEIESLCSMMDWIGGNGIKVDTNLSALAWLLSFKPSCHGSRSGDGDSTLRGLAKGTRRGKQLVGENGACR